jgi:hypothetical protein
MEDNQLHISPRTYEKYTKFADKLKAEQPDFLSEEFAEKVKIAIEESKCIMLFNFMSHVAFNQLYIETHVKQFKEACNALIDEVHDYVASVMDIIIDKQLQKKYPPLLNATKLVVKDFLLQQKEDLNLLIHKLIEGELFIFTQNIDYPIKVKSIETSDPVQFLQHALKVYSDIAISRFCDYVPMQCHLFFVTKLYKTLHEYVDIEIMSKHIIDDSVVADKRKEMETSIFRFERALKILENLK